MKKQSIYFVTIILVLFAVQSAQASGEDRGFSLKIGAGLGNLAGRDINASIRGVESEVSDLGTFLGLEKTGDLTGLNLGADIEGELLWRISRHFGLSIGSGYSLRTNKSETQIKLLPLLDFSIMLDPKYTLFPVNLNAYYFFSVGKRWEVFLKAGIGYYWGKISIDANIEQKEQGQPDYWENVSGEMKDSNVGFQGGLGIEFKATQKIVLFAEGKARFVKLQDWTGTGMEKNTFGEMTISGPVYYAEEYSVLTGEFYPSIFIGDEVEGTLIRNMRFSKDNFSGFSILVGARVQFGRSLNHR